MFLEGLDSYTSGDIGYPIYQNCRLKTTKNTLQNKKIRFTSYKMDTSKENYW